jgi:hypothetical protein
MNQPETHQPRARAISGKLIIVGIVAVALIAAVFSWVFRYNATHRAAEFWGPKGTRLIRDAPRVSLNKVYMSSVSKTRDISKAPGITHLRNALLEDRSFEWEGKRERVPIHDYQWMLTFSDPTRGETLSILFSSDCHGAGMGRGGIKGRGVSTEPISKGLCEVFTEYMPDVAPR